jgi:hypothetical protein
MFDNQRDAALGSGHRLVTRPRYSSAGDSNFVHNS